MCVMRSAGPRTTRTRAAGRDEQNPCVNVDRARSPRACFVFRCAASSPSCSEGLTRRRAAADAGFAESFFDLKRARYFPPSTNGVKPPPSYMRTSDQWACMLCLVGVPYLKVKIESWVARQGGGVRAALSSPALLAALTVRAVCASSRARSQTSG